MSESCSNCGGFENLQLCPHCKDRLTAGGKLRPSTLICDNCRSNHEFVCAENAKRLRRREGPTVRPPMQEVPTIQDAPQPIMRATEDFAYRAAVHVNTLPEVQVASEVYDDRDDTPCNLDAELEDFEHGNPVG